MSTSTPPPRDSHIIYRLSHLHPDPLPLPIVVLSLDAVEQTSPLISDDALFTATLARLDKILGSLGADYTLVVLSATSTLRKGQKSRLPGSLWWVWNWRRVPRRLRKNLKRLYIVHPTRFTQATLNLLLPFMSPKAYPKLRFVPSVKHLCESHELNLEGLYINVPTLAEESKTQREPPSGAMALLSNAASYLPLALPLTGTPVRLSDGHLAGRGYWDRTAEDLVNDAGGKVPPLLQTLRAVIPAECTATEGIFRRTSNSAYLPGLVSLLDLPADIQPQLPWRDLARDDPLLPPKVLHRVYGSLSEPLLPQSTYASIRSVKAVDDITTHFLPSLTEASRTLLQHLVDSLREVAAHASTTKMSPLALAIVTAPVLIRGPEALEDAALCLPPGKSLPKAMTGGAITEGEGSMTLVGLFEMWIAQNSKQGH